jgi:hypothetical protein
MIRIRGTVGAMPVDLTVEMDPQDWAQLGAQLQVQGAQASVGAPATSSPSAAKRSNDDDPLWRNALALVQSSGQISGPALLEQLEALAGSVAAAKRLLVRLRHNASINVQSGADAPLYCWVG